MGRDGARQEERVLEHAQVEGDRRGHALDAELGERPARASEGLAAVAAPDHELGQEAVVEGRHHVARVDVRVKTHPGPARRRPAAHRAGGRQEVAVRVLGIDAKLDRVTGDGHVVLADGKALARGHADTGLDDVDAGHHLGHAVLDLHAGVHLHEVELAACIEQELDRAGALVARGHGGIDGGLAHAGPQLG